MKTTDTALAKKKTDTTLAKKQELGSMVSWIRTIWLKWRRKISIIRIHCFKREIDADVQRLIRTFPQEDGFAGETTHTMHRYLRQLDLLETMLQGEVAALAYSQAVEVVVSAIEDFANSYNRQHLRTNLYMMNLQQGLIQDLYALVNRTNPWGSAQDHSLRINQTRQPLLFLLSLINYVFDWVPYSIMHLLLSSN